MYLLGVDGGGTKTQCIIGNENGEILSTGFSGGSNHQTTGAKNAETEISKAIDMALDKLHIKREDLSYAVLGLAGADMEEDYKVLIPICSRILGKVPHRIINDCWVALRAGNDQEFGVVSICGTGANAAGRRKDGTEFILRGLSYELGNFGGGVSIISQALHYSFRSDEGTGKKTVLEHMIPEILGMKSLNELLMHINGVEMDFQKFEKIPKLVFAMASEGDEVCQNILIEHGHTLGEMASGVIKRLGLEKEEVPVVLAGSIFNRESPLLIDEYTTTVHRTAPRAIIRVSENAPVTGAFRLAVDGYNKII